ncbi:unnamed protein product, partial [Darwinula stevensoni]
RSKCDFAAALRSVQRPKECCQKETQRIGCEYPSEIQSFHLFASIALPGRSEEQLPLPPHRSQSCNVLDGEKARKRSEYRASPLPLDSLSLRSTVIGQIPIQSESKLPATSNEAKAKSFRANLTRTLSWVYAIFILMVGVIIYMADLFLPDVRMAEVFNIYLSVFGLVFLIFLHADIRIYQKKMEKFHQQRKRDRERDRERFQRMSPTGAGIFFAWTGLSRPYVPMDGERNLGVGQGNQPQVVTQRGHRKVIVDGYIYLLDKKLGQKTYWRCEDRTCTSRLHSIGHVIVRPPSERYSHAPSSSRVTKAVMRSDVRRLALASESSTRKSVKHHHRLPCSPLQCCTVADSSLQATATTSIWRRMQEPGLQTRYADDVELLYGANACLRWHLSLKEILFQPYRSWPPQNHNSVEGWHNPISGSVNKAHFSVRALGSEASTRSLSERLGAGHQLPMPQKKYRRLNGRVKMVVSGYKGSEFPKYLTRELLPDSLTVDSLTPTEDMFTYSMDMSQYYNPEINSDMEKEEKTPSDPGYWFLTGRHSGSIYLKIGTAGFCLGHMIHEGLLLGRHIGFLASNDETVYKLCASTAGLLLFIIHPIFVFYQLFIVFKYSNVVIEKFKGVARFGLMHCISTSLCFWFWSIIRETVDHLQNAIVAQPDLLRPLQVPHNQGSSSLISAPLAYALPLMGLKAGKAGYQDDLVLEILTETLNHTAMCIKENELSGLIGKAAPYLHPFSIEFNILVAMMTVTVILAYRQIVKLDLITNPTAMLDTLLLFIAIPSFFLYGIFSTVPAVQLDDSLSRMSIVLSAMQVLQVIIQTPMIIEGLHRCTNNKDLKEKKPGRELITFLIIANLCTWIIETFEIKSSEAHADRIGFYGKGLWTLLSHMTLPLCLFYRCKETDRECFGYYFNGKMYKQEKVKAGHLLDKMVGFGKPKSKSRQERFYSDGDQGTNDEMNQILSELDMLTEQDLNEKFEKMLRGTQNRLATRFENPEDYINQLNLVHEMSANKVLGCVSSLRVDLTNQPLHWVKQFGIHGLKALLGVLAHCYSKKMEPVWEKVQYEVVRCIKSTMNNRIGLKQMYDTKDAFAILASSIDPTHPQVMLEAVKLIAAVCIANKEGFEHALRAITISSEHESRDQRFLPIVKGLLVKDNPQLNTACLQLINALVTEPEDLDFRLHLRNEFMRIGLGDILEVKFLFSLQSSVNLKVGMLDRDLMMQIEVFDSNRMEDYEDFISRFENIRVELEDSKDCFELVRQMIADTPAESSFLSILQHLAYIRDDFVARTAYFRLLEEVVSQIVLHRTGCDPNFEKFRVDHDQLREDLKAAEAHVQMELSSTQELQKKLDEALGAKQESDAQVEQLKQKLQMYEAGGVPSPSAGKLPQVNIPMPPMMPGTGPTPPPPPPGSGPPPPPPPPGYVGPPPPPPPPPPGGGPPPPPFPGLGPGPPPPPPPGGIPGIGPPRPLIQSPQKRDELPYGMKPKKKWDLTFPMKRANWKKINPEKLSEKAFWVKIEEDKLASRDILNGLESKFSTKPPLKTSDDISDKRPGTKKVKELVVLDSKAAQNLSILLGGSFKHVTYEEVTLAILRCDTSVLNETLLQQLIQYIPAPDQLKKLEEFKNRYDELCEAEQFALTVGSIKRLVPRLKSLCFKERFEEMMADVKPSIVAATAACEEVKLSKKFSLILELVLLFGNYMNSGTKNGQSVGFEISFLPKLMNTKDAENKSTLMHYLVETVENKFPDALSFADDLIHVEKAAKVSTDMLQKSLRQMESNIKNLEMDLKNSTKTPTSIDDRFVEVMSSFAERSREQYEIVQNMYKKMDSLFTALADYFVFDKTKYTLDEFFSDINSFKENFTKAYKDVLKLRETQEKIRLAQERKVKMEQEKAERVAKRKALVDMNADDDQEGVMDNLLQALQSGAAFAREQKRKRQSRPGPGERRVQMHRQRSRNNMLANTSAASSPSALEQLVEEIKFQRSKEMRQSLRADRKCFFISLSEGGVLVQGTTYWTDLFVRHFLFRTDRNHDSDDLLFFVRKKHIRGITRYIPRYETSLEVFRKDSRKLPIGDPDIDWEETVYLNLLIHDFEYTLTMATCTRTSPKHLQILRRHSQ